MEESMVMDRMEDRLRADGRNVSMLTIDAEVEDEVDMGSFQWIRSNRLRRMDAEGLNEGIGCMPMEYEKKDRSSTRGLIECEEEEKTSIGSTRLTKKM